MFANEQLTLVTSGIDYLGPGEIRKYVSRLKKDIVVGVKNGYGSRNKRYVCPKLFIKFCQRFTMELGI
jgi:hypothetical protein